MEFVDVEREVLLAGAINRAKWPNGRRRGRTGHRTTWGHRVPTAITPDTSRHRSICLHVNQSLLTRITYSLVNKREGTFMASIRVRHINI